MKNSNNDVSDKTLIKILEYSKNFRNISNYKGKTWVISDSHKVLRIIFESKNRIHYSINGKGSIGTWEITGGNKLIINVNNETIWYTPIFLDDNILILKLNSDGSLHCYLTEEHMNLSVESLISNKYFKRKTVAEPKQNEDKTSKIETIITKVAYLIFFLSIVFVLINGAYNNFSPQQNTISNNNETSQITEDSISYKINEISNDSLQYFAEGFALWCPKPLEKNYDMANKIGAQAVYECTSFDGIKYTITINDISIEYLNNTKTNDQIEDEYLAYYKSKLDENDVLNEFQTNSIKKCLIYYPTVPSNQNNLIMKSAVFIFEKKLILLQVTSEKDQIGAFDIFLNSFTEKTPNLGK
jgi:hypothetical protein